MKYLYGLLLAAALIGGLMWAGHRRGYDDGVAATQAAADGKVATAHDAVVQATAERDATAQTLANVQRVLDAKKRELEMADYYAKAAMDARNALQKQLTAATAARADALRKAAHDSPDCADLARLPVCPAVAERLWPAAAGSPASASH